MARVRLDSLLAERGLFASRSRAAAAVLAGDVRLGVGRRRADKPGQMVAADVEVDVAAAPAYVSRGGVKLANALDALGVPVAGRRALDVGASTGGFTDCLLQRGAEHVAALDVAYGELDHKLRQDPRVTVLERVNARALEPALLPYRPDLVVADVSFIGLAKVLPAILRCVQPESFDVLAMVKPQFEVGRERLGKGGVVRDPALRREALVAVAASVVDGTGAAAVLGFASSGLPGPKGNRETFV
ncbi:MAG TPA: TlyA family RNA methyltransferase, partial [Solirubrobacteraceae bacterium]